MICSSNIFFIVRNNITFYYESYIKYKYKYICDENNMSINSYYVPPNIYYNGKRTLI